MHRVRRTAGLPQFCLGVLLAAAVFTVGCQPLPPSGSSPSDADTEPSTETPAAPPASESEIEPDTPEVPTAAEEEPPAAQPDGAIATTTVPIYVMDDQCNDYVQRTVEVPQDEAMSEAVGQAIAYQDYDAFELAGYRVSYDASSGTATVDLRLDPNSERQFVSLTSCEQRSLFGSVEETLTQNPDWSVNAVEFTNRGEEILL